MPEDLFSLREKEIFDTLNVLKSCEFVVIGGYAVNAYALPRFSIDCDIVIKSDKELEKIEKSLLKFGYAREVIPHDAYSGRFRRYIKKLAVNFYVSMDILIENVTDRQTGVVISADWIFDNSKISVFRGKTNLSELKLRIIDIDALLVMKIISCRATDIRDVFMMIPNAKDISWVKKEISSRCDFKDRVGQLIRKIESKQFKDGISGVYGYLDQKVFDKHKKATLKLLD